MCGDVNGDGQSDIVDALFVAQYTVGLRASLPCGAQADVDLSDGTDIVDALFIAQLTVGLRAALGLVAAPVLDPHPLVTSDTNITITGTTRPGSTVEVIGPNGPFVVPAGGGAFSADVPFSPLGLNRTSQIFFTTISTCGSCSSPTATTITQDAQPPALSIDSPTNGANLTTAGVTVAGRVGDTLSGFMGLSVKVNGINAIVDPGIGSNGTFVAQNVPLTLGVPTTISATATDELGNSVTKAVSVTRVDVGMDTPIIEVASGDMQTATIGELLDTPIVARVRRGDGSPVEGATVGFVVTRSNGELSIGPDEDGAMRLDVTTGADGLATALWRLGNDSGCGNNRVEASSLSASGKALFSASANPAAASQINVASGNNQRVETGGPAPDPLEAWVSDGRNEVADVPVTFTVVEGGGKVDGQDSVTIDTDDTGHAEVDFVLGPAAGPNVVEANFAGNPGLPAMFVSTGIARDGNQPTSFSSLVLTNTDQPIQGALCTMALGGAPLPDTPPENIFTLTSDLEGRCDFPNLPLAGPADFFVDGLSASHVGGAGGEDVPAGSFPTLHFEIVLVPNAQNSLPMSVLLPALDPANAQVYDGTEDLELTMEGVEGLKMIVKAGSMRRVDGTMPTPENPAILSLNQVNFDDIPMPMPDGASPPFAWTLQPAGSTFDPPVEIQFPNLAGLAPGSTIYFLSFNHATSRFEIVATGHVTDDGSLMISDPGSGITLAGWGGFCPPYPNTGMVQGDAGDDSSDSDDPGTSGQGDPNSDPQSNNGTNGGETTDSPTDSERGEGGNGDDEDGRQEGGDPIILRTGELIVTETDLSIPGRGFPFELRRTYRSQYNRNGPLGFNWDFTYNERLLLPDPGAEDSSILRCSGRSRVDRYIRNPDGSFDSPDGFYDELEENPDGTFTLRDRYGMKKHFDVFGRLESIADRNGNTMTFEYDELGQLSVVTDTLGREISFIFNEKGRLAIVADFMGREVRYKYDANGDLVAVRSPVVLGTSTDNDFPNGKTTQYEYSSGFDDSTDPRLAFLNHNLVAIIDPKQQRYLVNTYGEELDTYEFDRVLTQQFGEPGQEYQYSYTELNPNTPITPNLPRNETVEIDRNGNRRVYIHNEIGNLLEEHVETNRDVNPDDPSEFVTTHTYNADGERLSTVFPEGNRIDYTFDSSNADRLQQGNLISVTRTAGPRGGDQSQLLVTRRYEPIFNQVLAETEERGNDPAFEPQNGGSASAARYTTTYTFDYQEGNTLAALATETGRSTSNLSALLSTAGVALDLGDINDDGITNEIHGNLVRRESPTVSLLADSAQAAIEGDTTQEIVTTYTYNRFGQMTSETDPEGNVDDYEYHPENDPDGDSIASISSRSLATDTGGYRAARIQDNRTSPRRRSTAALTQIRNEWLYDPVGNVIRTIDGRGNPTSYEVNALNQIVRVTLEPPFNYEHAYIYDANNNVVREEIQNVGTNGPDLDDSVTYTYEYDILDNRTMMTQEVSTSEILTTSYEYDNNENRTKLIQPEGNVVERVYDERDLVFSITRGAGAAEASTRRMTYDGNRNLIRTVDAADNNGDGVNEELLMSYDGFDRRTQTKDAVGNVATYSYDPAGNVTREQHFGLNSGPSPTDNSGTGNVLLAQREMSFDELSREFQRDDKLFSNIAAVGPEGMLTPGDGNVTTRFEYDRNGRLTRNLDDNIHQRLFEYDGVDRLIHEVDALNNEVAYSYDGNHNLSEILETERSPEGWVPDEEFHTTYEYDSIDRQSTSIDNLGNTTKYSYDSRNNVVAKQDALGNTTEHLYDGINRKLADVVELRTGGTGSGSIDTSNPANPDGKISKLYDWDGNSRLKSLTDDNGNTTTYDYDDLNRRRLETFADGTTNTYEFDGDDNLITFTDENGSVHTNVFDGINRMVSKDVVRAPGVEGTTEWRFEYDGLSRRTKATDNNDPTSTDDDSVVELQYDSLSRLLVENQNGKTVQNEFDGVGNRLACTYPNGRVVETTFDDLDRIADIRNQGSGDFIAEYDYLGPERTLERRYGNGTRLSYQDDEGQDIGYDGLKRRLLHNHETSTGQLIEGFRHAFDKRHNRRYEQNLLRNTADVFEYDSAYRVIRSGLTVPSTSLGGITNNNTTNADVADLAGTRDVAYQLDGVGNWVLRTTEVPTLFTSNVVNEYTSVGGVPHTYDDNGNLVNDGNSQLFHDAANRLVRVAGVGGTIARYTYDGLGRRIAKNAGGAVLAFYYDRARSIEERDGADNMLRQYVFGRGIDEVLELRAGGQSYFYQNNFLGSAVAITDAAGNVVERYRYDTYGAATIFEQDGVTEIPSSTVGNPLRFTGRRFDEETGLYYYRARYYDPSDGRFIQRDPKGYVDGLGLYEYVAGNPLRFVDPLGVNKGAPQPGGPDYEEWSQKTSDELDDLWEQYKTSGQQEDLDRYREAVKEANDAIGRPKSDLPWDMAQVPAGSGPTHKDNFRHSTRHHTDEGPHNDQSSPSRTDGTLDVNGTFHHWLEDVNPYSPWYRDPTGSKDTQPASTSNEELLGPNPELWAL